MKNIVLWESLVLNTTVVDSECRLGNLCSGHSHVIRGVTAHISYQNISDCQQQSIPGLPKPE